MKKKVAKILISVFLVVAIAVGAVFLVRKGGPQSGEGRATVSYEAKRQPGINGADKLTKCFDRGNYEFLVDEESAAIIIKNGENIVFNSSSDYAAQKGLACIVKASLLDENGNRYLFNSTDNSALLGGAQVSCDGEGAAFVFSFYKDKAGAADKAVWFTLPVFINQKGEGFEISTDTNEVKCADGLTLETVTFLPGLFSVDNSNNEGMFYTVPDGCGAQISLDGVVEDDFFLDLPVYGSDTAFEEFKSGAYLPCFAFTRDKTLCTVIIQEGDALSEIYAERMKNCGGSLYNTFTVTANGELEGKYASGNSYKGSIAQTYILSDKGSGDYNTIASLVRDNLISRGYLSHTMTDEFKDLPFFVSVAGASTDKKKDVYTSFENGAEIIALLKSRGVRSVAMRFVGAAENGLASDSYDYDKLNEAMGGAEGFRELCSVAQKNSSSVWYNLDILTGKETEEGGVDVYSDICRYLGVGSTKHKFLSSRSVNNNISSAYKLFDELEAGNVCINDASTILYTDVKGSLDRQRFMENLADKCGALEAGGAVMLSKPAVYLMNYADAVFDMPVTADSMVFGNVTPVPLLQMVLHGSLYYGSEVVNASDDSLGAVLKAVEYGAVPAFLFTHSGSDFLDYGPYATSTAKYYSMFKRMLPLMDMEITSHERVVSGVYRITYDYSKVVYVNYNPSVVDVDGVLVSAQDFVII